MRSIICRVRRLEAIRHMPHSRMRGNPSYTVIEVERVNVSQMTWQNIIYLLAYLLSVSSGGFEFLADQDTTVFPPHLWLSNYIGLFLWMGLDRTDIRKKVIEKTLSGQVYGSLVNFERKLKRGDFFNPKTVEFQWA